MVNRAKTRTLVRWSDDHDKELLLWLQYCCNEQGIKIPFPRVAQCMGPSFTEGAIVQHLAKIRTKMEDAGLHVPPAQKRGTVTRAASSIYKPKAKSTTAPVPRVRPDTDPHSRARGICDEEEEEETGPRLDFSAQAKSRRVTKRQSATRRAAAVVKQESDEDDPLAGLDDELYDSDNEYGAKKPRTRKKRSPIEGLKETHRGRVALNTKQPTLASYGYDKIINPASMSFNSPTTTGYATADGLDGSTPMRGIRRKSAAMATQENIGDYDNPGPGQNGSGGSDNSQDSQTIKKQKVNHDHDAHAGNNGDAAMLGEGYPDIRNYGHSRAGMPPPAFPPAPADYGYTWDNEFMQGPFHSLSLAETSNGIMGVNSDAFAHTLPADVTSFNMDFGSGINGYRAVAPPFTGHEYYHDFAAPVVSNASTRNNSFASASTDSTVESQPTSWQQPLRSPIFPNPHEAAHVLHQAVNTTSADESSFINIFDTSGPSIEGSRDGFDSGFNSNDNTNRPLSNHVSSSELFVGLPDESVDDIDYSNLLNADEFDG